MFYFWNISERFAAVFSGDVPTPAGILYDKIKILQQKMKILLLKNDDSSLENDNIWDGYRPRVSLHHSHYASGNGS